MRATACLIAALLMAAPLPAAASAGGLPFEPDPFEPMNRVAFAINHRLVRHALDPAAAFLGAVVPESVKQGGANAFANLAEPVNAVSLLIDGDLAASGNAVGRFVINSTLGLGGLFDPADPIGLPRRDRPFTEALCRRGLADGIYLVLPFIGPTTGPAAMAALGLMAGSTWVLSFHSTALAVASVALDLSASAASLRGFGAEPEPDGDDPYVAQRQAFRARIDAGCPSAQAGAAPQ